MTSPEPPLITRLRIASSRSAAVSTPEDWKRSACGHFTYAEAEEAMAWIAEVRAAALEEAALVLDWEARRGHLVSAENVQWRIRALKGTP